MKNQKLKCSKEDKAMSIYGSLLLAYQQDNISGMHSIFMRWDKYKQASFIHWYTFDTNTLECNKKGLLYHLLDQIIAINL